MPFITTAAIMDVSRYDFPCQKALHQGLQYARSLGHQTLEVEHVALALLRGDALDLPSAGGERLKRHLESHLARIPRIFGKFKISFGSRLDRALDVAENEATAQTVEPELLWRSLVRQSTVVQTFMAKAQPDWQQASSAAEGTTGKKKAAGSSTGGSASGTQSESDSERNPSETEIPEKQQKFLRQYTTDLSEKAERDELDPVIGREREVRRVLEILGRKKKNNPVLIGEPGVGKSAVADAIALRIAEGNVPESMRGMRVISLDLGAMLAGAKYRGEFEDRMKNLLEALDTLRGKVILFVDEIHMLVGAGNGEGGADAANLMKPALARGDLQCIGATTLDEYRQYIEKDAALERRFQPLYVEEPDRDTARAILRGLKSRYEIHHGVQIGDEALSAAVDFSARYLTGRRLPDKAIDLVDEAASRLRLQIDSVPAILDQLRAEIERVEIERKALGEREAESREWGRLSARLEAAKSEYNDIEGVWRRHQELLDRMKNEERKRQEHVTLYENAKAQGDFDFAARLQYEEIPKADSELERIDDELRALQNQYGFLRQVVGSAEVASVVAAWTGIPVGRLMESEAHRLLSIEDRLGQRVFGQREALRRIGRAVKRARAGVNDPRRPLGVFLFLGPTGVGKTEMARALAEEMFSDEGRMVRIDMSEYGEAHAASRLTGAPPGYVGHGEGGELTERVRERPYSIVLLDEIEKAHTRVLDVLLQLFEDGRLTDGNGKTADFRNTLIIMTSNILVGQKSGGREPDEDGLRQQLTRHWKPEFVNRVDEVIRFRGLGERQLTQLLDKLIADLNARLADRQFRIELGSRLRESLIHNCLNSSFGGRSLRRAFQKFVVDGVSDRILEEPELACGAWTMELDEDGGLQWINDSQTQKYLPAAPD